MKFDGVEDESFARRESAPHQVMVGGFEITLSGEERIANFDFDVGRDCCVAENHLRGDFTQFVFKGGFYYGDNAFSEHF